MSNIVPYQEITQMAEAIAKSQLFGMKMPDQVIALMLVAQANNQHPAAAARDYDIINGRPAKKAEAMLRDFIGAGGSVQWHQLADEIADATFSHQAGGSVRIEWTMRRAFTAGLTGKDNWKKWPRQMLRSRCISEGVRTVYPVATGGMHAPEEIQDMPVARLVQISEAQKVAVPAIPQDRYIELEAAFGQAESMDAVASIWKAMTKDERKAVAHLKDNAKERLSEPAQEPEQAA